MLEIIKKKDEAAVYVARRANSGAAWQPSCQKLSELAEIIGLFETFYNFETKFGLF